MTGSVPRETLAPVPGGEASEKCSSRPAVLHPKRLEAGPEKTSLLFAAGGPRCAPAAGVHHQGCVSRETRPDFVSGTRCEDK
jgi:hypothetical protein